MLYGYDTARGGSAYSIGSRQQGLRNIVGTDSSMVRRGVSLHVDETVFNPPPKVKSAVIRMTRNEVMDLGCDERLFKRVVKTVFNQRRKMLRVSLRQIFGGSASPEFYTQDIMIKRPEQLSVQQFVELTNMVAEEAQKIGKTL